jgi:hypothetical protein
MNKDEIRFHLRDRWKAVAEIERQELRASTVKENWEKLNAIMLRARQLNLSRGHDNNEMEVFLRWAKLREKYEASKRSAEVP